MKNVKQYYKELGRLVYAVAIADGKVQNEERLKLHEFVIKHLATQENDSDSSGMNKAFYVDFEFENAETLRPELSATLMSFNRFISDNAEPGDSELLALSVKLLKTVAEAYAKKREKAIIDIVEDKVTELDLKG